MRYKVMLAVPSSGTLCEESAQVSWLASLKHEVFRHPCTRGVLNFNMLLCEALNAGQEGRYTHLAMMHTDIQVVEDESGLRWVDRLIEELDAHDLDFVSTPIAIKDHRGLTSSGIGNPADRWSPFRRLTVAELGRLPVTFTAADVGYPDKFLLHNEALCVFDLRKPVWYTPVQGPDGLAHARCMFHLNEDIVLVDGKWHHRQETEDWSFSRHIWLAGAKTAISRRVKVIHFGRIGFENWGDGGTYRNGDEDTRDKWGAAAGGEPLRPAQLNLAGAA